MTLKLPAIGDVQDPNQISVVIYINGQQVHVPLKALVKQLQAQLDDHEARLVALEP